VRVRCPQKEVVPFTVKMDVVETLPPPPVSVVVVSSSSNPSKAQLTKARLNRMIRIDLRYILILFDRAKLFTKPS
jgi:aspartate/methionine/tyrosine aminotransferase